MEETPSAWKHSFFEFHEVLQTTMGWRNKELHEFRYSKGRNLTDVITAPHEETVTSAKLDDERKLTLAHFPIRN